MRPSLTLFFALALCLSGCGATRLDDSVWKRRTAEQASDGVGNKIRGSVPADLSPPLVDPIRAGAHADFVIERGPLGKPSDRWEVRLTAPAASAFFTSQTFELTFTFQPKDQPELVRTASTAASFGTLTVSKNGGEPETSKALFPLGITGLGFMTSCALAVAPRPDLEGLSQAQLVEAAMPYIEYFFPLLAMVKIADGNKIIKQLMLDTVQFPSWWTLLSLSISIEPDFSANEAVPVETAFGPGYQVPFNLKINGDPALYATMTVVDPTGVLQLTGGIIAIDGFAPDQPDQLFTLRFAGAQYAASSDGGLGLQPKLEWK